MANIMGEKRKYNRFSGALSGITSDKKQQKLIDSLKTVNNRMLRRESYWRQGRADGADMGPLIKLKVGVVMLKRQGFVKCALRVQIADLIHMCSSDRWKDSWIHRRLSLQIEADGV